MESRERRVEFEELVVPHLPAAYNLARWLVRQPEDAEDLVQEAYLRAFRGFDGYHGGDSRSWLLAIVRNACYSFLDRRPKADAKVEFDEQAHTPGAPAATPEALLLEKADRNSLQTALAELPVDYREAIVLRELEGMSYREIAQLTGAPVGTVMSRLSRARQQLQRVLLRTLSKGATG